MTNATKNNHHVSDEFWMSRCLELAQHGSGHVAPNPMVGCVIVYNEIIIGESYHKAYGLAHAEVNAIAAVQDPSLLPKATLYVNLEPCSHQGKTPPCADLIVRKKIKRVVIGGMDPNEKVNGAGIKRLRKNGIDVRINVLQEACLKLNKRFYTFHQKKRPYYILKWAQTSNGFIFSKNENQNISNQLSNQKVHQIRAMEQAILIGKNTLMVDNPSLNVRLVEGNDPLRIIVLSKLDYSIKEKKILQDGKKTLVFNQATSQIEGMVEYIKYPAGQLIPILNKELHARGIASVLVEGGTLTLQNFIDRNCWDEAFKIVSSKKFQQGTVAPTLSYSADTTSKVAQPKAKPEEVDHWIHFTNKHSK